MSRNFTPDETLVDQLFLDDTLAFEEIHHRYCYPLYSYCTGKLNSAADARRIVRDIFITLWEKRHTLQVGFSLSLYLYTEVRKCVVRCINEKLETSEDLATLEKQVIPGFAVMNLQKARQPVKRIAFENNVPQKEKYQDPWWNYNPSGINIKVIKNTLQKAFNLL